MVVKNNSNYNRINEEDGEYLSKPSTFSSLFYIWVLPLLRTGYKNNLEKTDIKKHPDVTTTQFNQKLLQEAWNYELSTKNKGKRSLCRVLLKAYWKKLAWWTFVTTIKDAIFRVAQAPCLAILVGYFSAIYSLNTGIIAGCLLFLFSGVYTVCSHYQTFKFGVIGLEIRAGLSAIIYKKTLKLSTNSFNEYSVGKITNIVSNDLNRFVNNLPYFGSICSCPLQAVTITIVLWYYFGPSAIAGTILVFCLFPFQVLFGKIYGAIRLKGASKTDVRVRITNEVLSGIFLIKMLTWENYFAHRVSDYRKEETGYFRQKYLLDAVNQSLWDVTSKLVVFAIFLSFILLGNDINVTEAFVALTLANYLRTSVTCYFPLALTGSFELLTSIRRVQALLEMEEKDNIITEPNTRLSDGLIIENFSGGWGKPEEVECLTNVSMKISPGKLTAIIGSVGSGKTSLIHGILNELPWSRGSISYSGQISYVAQQPWLFPRTVRENILHGNEYDKDWYEKVVQACALERDFTLFPYGDMTLIGDKGISLSGGQKARVTLARAVYANADVYLFDDLLSAVDSHVGQHIFTHCIQGLLGKKAVLLATHQIQMLDKCHVIYVLQGGKIIGYGDYNSINTMNILPKEEKDEEITDMDNRDEGNMQKKTVFRLGEETGYGTFDLNKSKSQLEKKEDSAKGKVNTILHWKYFRSGNSSFVLFIFLISNIATQVVLTSSDIWLQYWTQQNEIKTLPFQEEMSFLWDYLFIFLILWIFSITRNILLYTICIRSSNSIYNKLFATIIKAPMLFFEQNPFGRILNRFTNDVGIMDERLPNLYYNTISIGLTVVAAVILVIYVKPLMIIITIIIIPIAYFLRNLYLNTSLNLRRLESVSRSPLYGLLSSSVNGIITIRSTKTEDKYENEFCLLSDEQVQIYFYFLGTSRWFASTMDWLCNLYIAVLVIVCLVYPGDPAVMALIITQLMNLSNLLSAGLSIYAELDNQVVSVERILDYTNIKPETDLGSQPPTNWPTTARIEINDLVVRYGDNPPVLDNISCTFNSKEKIGIVGRTGAGKSTLLASLLRIVNPSYGMIHIDGIDTSKITLSCLRSKISVIPQNPVLFIGTIRENLDPFKQYNDSDIWKALKDVQMEERINSGTITGLEAEIHESGENFSQGEKQLLCLARALLINTKILILDEATANIDFANDVLIQKILREKFIDCTVITIAHRLHSIMDSDKVLVLDSGRIVEFGDPYELLKDVSNGVFRQFVEDSGPRNAKMLFNKALESYNIRKKAS